MVTTPFIDHLFHTVLSNIKQLFSGVDDKSQSSTGQSSSMLLHVLFFLNLLFGIQQQQQQYLAPYTLLVPDRLLFLWQHNAPKEHEGSLHVHLHFGH